MEWIQKTITLQPKSRGFHLITNEVCSAIPELTQIRIGIAHFFIQHTSASLTINENFDPDVRNDMEMICNKLAPDITPGSEYTHVMEGSDDMPAHVKSSLLGSFISIPITNGVLALGTWQGIWLGEHRFRGGSRSLVITIQGTTK